MSAVLPLPAALPVPWRRALPPLLLLLAATLLLYRESFAAMVGIWARSGTFAHAFLVPPVVLWLVWRRRVALAAVAPQPQPAWLFALAIAALAWALGDLAGVNALTQAAATALLVLVVPALLGTAVARVLVFPLLFLFFMVPTGEFVMPTLMQWTADVTVAALRAFGIPVYREGLQFVIPSGTWSVVEACSGVRYLIASFMVGTLFASLNYRSTRRRVAFMAVSLVVPIVANWARAVIIVLLGHWSNNRIAAGVDHLIYGWVFFGVVVGLMFFIGARWAEAPAALASTAIGGGTTLSPAHFWVTAAVTAVVLALPPLGSTSLRATPKPPPRLLLPALPGTVTPLDAVPLHRPAFEGASVEVERVYQEGAAAVTVHVAYYRQQTYGHKLVNSQNMLVHSEDPRWHVTASGERELTVGGGTLQFRSAELRAGSVGAAVPEQRLQVRQIYWVDGRLTTSDRLAALFALRGQLSGRGDDAAAITFYATAEQAPALDDFVARHLEALTAALTAARATP